MGFRAYLEGLVLEVFLCGGLGFTWRFCVFCVLLRLYLGVCVGFLSLNCDGKWKLY